MNTSSSSTPGRRPQDTVCDLDVEILRVLGPDGTHEAPKVAIYPLGTSLSLGDTPNKHRWRAWWDKDYNGRVVGIALQAYPVTRVTPQGAWIDPYAYTQATRQPWEDGAPAEEWVTSDVGLRWVSDDGAQAWAKQTKEQALASLVVRLTRWAQHAMNDVKRVIASADAACALFAEDTEPHRQAAAARSDLLFAMRHTLRNTANTRKA